MMLTEQTPVSEGALPIDALKDHMRLGTGFAAQSGEDAMLVSFLRAAMAAIEGRTGKALLERSYSWTVTAWRETTRQALPVAPVQAITQFVLTDAAGNTTAVPPSSYRLARDTHRPMLEAVGGFLPTIPLGGEVAVYFDAGFGPSWADVPADLALAVFKLATHYYEVRATAGFGEPDMPYDVARMIEPWRTVRILGGGRA